MRGGGKEGSQDETRGERDYEETERLTKGEVEKGGREGGTGRRKLMRKSK